MTDSKDAQLAWLLRKRAHDLLDQEPGTLGEAVAQGYLLDTVRELWAAPEGPSDRASVLRAAVEGLTDPTDLPVVLSEWANQGDWRAALLRAFGLDLKERKPS